MKNIVVLGGTGFLGRHVLQLLSERGHRAASLSRREGCDILDLSQLSARLRQVSPDAVINCAAHVGSVHYVIRRAADIIHDNTQMILNTYAAVKAACPRAAIINPLANCAYPGEADIFREPEWQVGPVHDSVLAYGTTRRLLHAVAQCYRRQHGVRSVNWLIPNAYGPGDHIDPDKVHALNGIIIRLIKAQRAGDRTFEIWGTGTPIREWVYMRDVAHTLVESLEVEEQMDPVNLAQNKGYSVVEISRIAAGVLCYDVEFRFNTLFGDGAPCKILEDRQFRALRPDFRFTPLEEGIRQTIAFYQQILPAGEVAAA